MEKSINKSQEQAEIIKMISLPILALDLEYCQEAAEEMINQAHRQESMAILNPSHALAKNDVLRLQGEALSLLVKYVETLKKVEEKRIEVKKEEKGKADIARLFW